MNELNIPKGDYCYTYINNKQVLCPYWEVSMEHNDQENGYCNYLKVGDWERDSLSLLWDQVKECDINL